MEFNQTIQGRIYVKTGVYAGAEIPIEGNLVIGRDPKVCHLILDDPHVSRRHCEITFNEKKNLYYVEVFSGNGVLRSDGSIIKSGYQDAVQPGDI